MLLVKECQSLLHAVDGTEEDAEEEAEFQLGRFLRKTRQKHGKHLENPEKLKEIYQKACRNPAEKFQNS